jgi:hypothetical protein
LSLVVLIAQVAIEFAKKFQTDVNQPYVLEELEFALEENGSFALSDKLVIGQEFGLFCQLKIRIDELKLFIEEFTKLTSVQLKHRL